MNTRTAPNWRDLFTAPVLAALVAWLAVWFSLEGLAVRDPQAGWIARGAALVFLAGFLGEHFIGCRLGPRAFAALAVLLAAAALVPVALMPRGAAPILLVLLAAMLAGRFEGRTLWLALGAVNLVLGLVLAQDSVLGRGYWITLFAYASFQAFAALVMRYAADSERMAGELRVVNADLMLTRSLLAERARDGERLRLSRELHDVAGHKLTALKLNLAALARDPRFQHEDAIVRCAGLADELLGDLRNVVRELRRDEGVDLEAALTALAQPFPRPRLELEVDPALRAASVAQAEVLLRAVQEALTNAARHSQAQHLWVVLRREDGRLRLSLRDDGRGDGPIQPGHGLTGMRERFALAGGGVEVSRATTGGVQIEGWLPEAA